MVWTPTEQATAVNVSEQIFNWGGVLQDALKETHTNIRAVIEAALNEDAASTALMDGGWTKIAALATGESHVIRDSRVSTSVVRRLDRIIFSLGLLIQPPPYDQIGFVNVGRGGTRPLALTTLNFRWCGGYGSSCAQVTRSAFLRRVRDELNDPKAGWTARSTPWTIRDIEMMLFHGRLLNLYVAVLPGTASPVW